MAGFICVHGMAVQAQAPVPGAPSDTAAPSPAAPSDTAAPAAVPKDAPVGFFTGLTQRDTLLGDAGGLRSLLGRSGVTVQAVDMEEWLGNVSGGLQRGATYDAATTLTIQLDTQKAFGWQGGTFNVSALELRGRSLSQYYLDNLQTVSGIVEPPTTRLWEAWFQQELPDGAFDVRVGLQSIDQEFMVSAGSALYLNTAMGWPILPSVDLYAGGPAYPLSSLGVRVHRASGPFAVLAGVFQDNPPGGPFSDDSQLRGTTRWGGNFNLRTGALFIAEMQYALNQSAAGEADHAGTPPPGLPGTYKLGMWFDTAPFPDQRYDSAGLSLANPASTGVPRMDHANFSVYGVADQVVWQPDPRKPRAVAVFFRAMGTPGDRNLVAFCLDAGANLKAPLPGRDDDTLGIGIGVARVGPAAAGLDRDTALLSGIAQPVRSTETLVEVTYQARLLPWLQVQPDFQFVHRPGGGVPDPSNPAQRLKDEAVFGVRSTITF